MYIGPNLEHLFTSIIELINAYQPAGIFKNDFTECKIMFLYYL